MYRDDRGILYHPHLRVEIPLGTRSVDEYERPNWLFNKILYSEKEGIFEVLKDAGFPERHDLALLTSKGQPTRAARDLLDLLAESGEPIKIYAIHDADGPGTVIYQSLVEATRARPGRKVEVINLGLEPDEVKKMGLEIEELEGGKTVPVAAYVSDEDREWYQGYRTEINVMTTPELLDWLEGKLSMELGKLVPPDQVVEGQLRTEVERTVREVKTEQILRDNGLEEQVKEAVRDVAGEIEQALAGLPEDVEEALDEDPEQSWRQPVRAIAQRIATGDDDES
jgi:hypothetical protein